MDQRPDAFATVTEPGDEIVDRRFRRTIQVVVCLNIAYFGIEFAAAGAVGSVALFADSVDFLEDTSINLLILASLGWSPLARARMGSVLAAILLVPGLATLWTAWTKVAAPVAPQPAVLVLAALGAFAVNLTCTILLAARGDATTSLGKAAFLSARNDALANVAIVAAGLITAFVWHTAWPDLIVGLAIAALNLDAARDVWTMARAEGARTRAAALDD